MGLLLVQSMPWFFSGELASVGNFIHVRQLEICIDLFPFHLRASPMKDEAVDMLYLLDMSNALVSFFGLTVPKIF